VLNGRLGRSSDYQLEALALRSKASTTISPARRTCPQFWETQAASSGFFRPFALDDFRIDEDVLLVFLFALAGVLRTNRRYGSPTDGGQPNSSAEYMSSNIAGRFREAPP